MPASDDATQQPEQTQPGSRAETGTGSEVFRRACPPFLATRPLLASAPGRWNWTRIVHEQVPSTSDLARELVQQPETRLPLVVWAREQTNGRGRGAHTWWSDRGSLTFTIALDPKALSLRLEHTPTVALAAAVAIIESLEPLAPGAPLGIRWPNDLEAGGRKLGGILPEHVETPFGPRLLIGIGLNVHTNLEAAPAAVRRMATSLAALLGPNAEAKDPEDLLDPILQRLASTLQALSAGDPSLAERWRQLDTLAEKPVRIDLGGKIVAGVARGIDDRGGLRVAAETGREPVTLYGGQVLREP